MLRMAAGRHREGDDRGGLLAFVVTAASAYVTLLVGPDQGLPAERWAALLALGGLYLLLGSVGLAALGPRVARGQRWAGWLYFALQLPLVGLILYLSNIGGFIAILLFPLVSQALGLLPRPQAILACALIVLTFIVPLGLLAGWGAVLLNSVVVVAGVIFVAVFTDVALRERRARSEIERLAGELAAAYQKVREYAAQVEELATTRERNRLAREIHDSLGHYLTVINVQLEAAQVLLEGNPSRAHDALRKAQSLAQEGLADVRRSVAALRAAPTEQRPLPEAVAELAEECRAAGIVTYLDVRGQPRGLAPQAELTLYRAAQEALTNVRKHSRASRADLTLDYAAPDQVRLVVADNGVGAGAAEGGFGLVGLRERVQLLGGSVRVETAVGRGFRLEVATPG